MNRSLSDAGLRETVCRRIIVVPKIARKSCTDNMMLTEETMIDDTDTDSCDDDAQSPPFHMKKLAQSLADNDPDYKVCIGERVE